MRKPGKRRRLALEKKKIDDCGKIFEDAGVLEKMKKEKNATQIHELFSVDTSGSCEGISRSTRREIFRKRLFPEKERLPTSGIERKRIMQAKTAMANRQQYKRPKHNPSVFDLWEEKEKPPPESQRQFAPRVFPVRMPNTLHQKVGKAPAVLVAGEGQSINPQKKAHDDLVNRVVIQQLHCDRAQQRLDDAICPKETADVKATTNEAADADNSLEDNDNYLVKKSKQCKGIQFRNAKRRRRLVAVVEAQAKRQERLDRSVDMLPSFLKKFRDDEIFQASRKQYFKAMRARNAQLEKIKGIVPKGRRLCKTKPQAEHVVIPEVSSSWRTAPLNANPALERTASLTRRGMILGQAVALPHVVTQQKEQNLRSRRIWKVRKTLSPLVKASLR